MSKVLSVVVSAGLFAGLGLTNDAHANPACFPIQGEYTLEQTSSTNCPDALVCYQGKITRAGLLNGATFVKIFAVAPYAGLSSTSGARGSYQGESTITTNQGTVTFYNLGLFAFASNLPTSYNLLQSDTSVVSDGTGTFASASGYGWDTGFAYSPPDSFVTKLTGSFHGTLCLGED